MTINTYTNIYLTNDDLKQVLMEYYKEKGYIIECRADIAFSVSKRGDFESDDVSCALICNKKKER